MNLNTIYLEHECSDINPVSNKNRAPDNRPSDMSYALIKRIHNAVKAGHIKQPFTKWDIEDWMSEYNIRKEDGTKYKKDYAANLLSTSLIKKKKTKNRNSKWLHRRKNENGDDVYWFAD